MADKPKGDKPKGEKPKPFMPTTHSMERVAMASGRENLPYTIEELGKMIRGLQQELGECVAAGDPERMIGLLQALAQDCGYVGATGLAAKLEQLQRRAEAGELDDPMRDIDPVLVELDAFLDALGVRLDRARKG